MFYPTVKFNRRIHAVKNVHSCECNIIYRKEVPKKQKELFKPISLRSINSISCNRCRKILVRRLQSFDLEIHD